MKRKVRIRKAQFGGIAAMQDVAPQTQISDEQIVDAVISMSQNGQDTDYILSALVSAGVEQERAVSVLQGLQDTVTQQQELEVAQDEQNIDTVNELQAEQDASEIEAEEELQRYAQMAQLYGNDAGSDDEGSAEEDYTYVENNLMQYGGRPSKKSFMHNAMKTIKAQEGIQIKQNIADATDTGERNEQLNKFLGTVKFSGDEALIKKDAAAMYDMMMPQAQFGANMRPGQQRRMMRKMNRAIGRIPIPTSSVGFPTPFNIITAPMMGGFADYQIPDYGSYAGGPRMANIDVRRTGLFGRPKEYTITFAQEAFQNPRLQEDVYRLEERNIEENIKETETDQKAKDIETKTDSKINQETQQNTNTKKDEIKKSQVIKSSIPKATVAKDKWGRTPDNDWYGFDPKTKQWTLGPKAEKTQTVSAQPQSLASPVKNTSKPKNELLDKIIKAREANKKNYGPGMIKQEGGYVDPFNPMLQKFIYGGNDDITLPEIEGKLTNSPYFQNGGEGKSKTKKWEDLTPEEKTELMQAYEEEKARVNQARSSSGYNTYSPEVFPGGFAKQRGLPYDPYTGQRLYKDFDPSTMSSNLSYIDVTKTRLSGAPKKYTMYFGHYDPTNPIISPSNVAKSTSVEDDNWTRRDDRRSVRDQLGRNYRIDQFLQNRLQIDNDRSPRLRNWIDQKRSERLNVPFLEPKAYGGIPQAQMAGQSPFVYDPRFAPMYTDNPEFIGMSNLDLITPNVPGMTNIPAGMNQQSVFYGYDPSAVNTIDASGNITDFNPSSPNVSETTGYKQSQADPTMNIEIDPNQPNRETMERNKLKDSWAVDLKMKNSNAQNLKSLGIFNAGADMLLSTLGERGDVERMRQMYDQMTGDALYGSTNISDRGTYETNSGLFRPDEMGFKGVVQYGGSLSYEEGGETYMSEEQIRKFLEEGGELEFV